MVPLNSFTKCYLKAEIIQMEYMEPLLILEKIYTLSNVFALHRYIYSFYFKKYIHRKLNHKVLKNAIKLKTNFCIFSYK